MGPERKKDSGRTGTSERAEYMFAKFLPVAKKYAKLNGIELGDDGHGERWSVYDFLNEARFIDFAYDECGEIFNLDMFI